jgi:hypothetical protein
MAKHPQTAKDPDGIKSLEDILGHEKVRFTEKTSTKVNIR